jgi:hypothetical protein
MEESHQPVESFVALSESIPADQAVVHELVHGTPPHSEGFTGLSLEKRWVLLGQQPMKDLLLEKRKWMM